MQRNLARSVKGHAGIAVKLFAPPAWRYSLSMTTHDPLLHTLGGRPAPFDIKFDLKELLLTCEVAQDSFWQLLAPAVAEASPDGLQGAVAKLCEDHALTPERVGRALRVCRLLFREGARRNIAPELLAQDLAVVAPNDAEALCGALVLRYQQLAGGLRQEILYGALTDHGSLLTGVSWRVDEMKLSQRGAELASAVTLITLSYVDGNEKKRVTLQALPDTIAQLRSMCDSLL